MPAPRSSFLPDPQTDSHIHTHLCGHATGKMEEYVLSAIRKGLKKIIFLEHLEERIHYQPDTWLSEEKFDYYFSEGRRLQEHYGWQIDIGLGVECGYNPDCADNILARLSRRKWDQIGISCHFLKLPGMHEHINLFSRKEENIQLARKAGTEKLLTLYFRALHEAIQLLPGTMICHLDGALRFVPEAALTDTHYQMIDALLQTAAAKGMTLEINTSGLAIRNEPFPNQQILSQALSRNIPLILGSDAHKPEDVGRQFDEITGFIPSKSYP